MKRAKIASLLLVSCCLLAAGCGNKTDQSALTDKLQDLKKAAEASDNTEEPEAEPENKPQENEAPEEVPFAHLSVPVEMNNGKTKLAQGSYNMFFLDDDMKEAYPGLNDFFESYNQKSEENLINSLEVSEEEAADFAETGIYYESIHTLYPLRSDSSVFSFIEENWDYYGGAHGSVTYTGYHIDPVTGINISFSDVVADIPALSDIVMTELVKQNEDLEEYFESDDMGKKELVDSLPGRFANDAQGIAWGLTYEGLQLAFEDYAMGSYVAGTRIVLIRFKDYPDLFTGKFAQYAGVSDLPDINKIARDDGTEGVHEYVPSWFSPDDGITNTGAPLVINKDTQRKMNIFISNFAEQGMTYYDYGRPDYAQVGRFAFRWAYLNKYDYVEADSNNYKISLKNVQKIAEKYLDLKVTENDMLALDKADDYGCFYKNGYFCAPLADGESYPGFAVVDIAEDVGGGMLKLNFTSYDTDLDLYFEDGTPDSFYSFNSDEAKNCKDIEMTHRGYAIVKPDGDSYKLHYYEILN